MGKILIIITLMLLGAGGIFFYLIRGPFVRCATQYESEIVTATQTPQTMFADKHRSCTATYETLMQWDVCRQQSKRYIPVVLHPFLVSFVDNISFFLRDQEKDIEFYKRDHDERCKGYSYLLFYPPESE